MLDYQGDKVKTCSRCGEEKPATEFYKDPRKENRLRTVCKSCWAVRKKAYKEKNRDRIAESDRRYYEANKEKIIQRKSKWQKENQEKVNEKQRVRREQGNKLLLQLKTPCVKCGESKPWVIQFHHIDPKQKQFLVTLESVMTKEWEMVLAEAAKCACLCANCHTEFHYFHRKNKDNPIGAFEQYLRGDIYDIERPSRD